MGWINQVLGLVLVGFGVFTVSTFALLGNICEFKGKRKASINLERSLGVGPTAAC